MQNFAWRPEIKLFTIEVAWFGGKKIGFGVRKTGSERYHDIMAFIEKRSEFESFLNFLLVRLWRSHFSSFII